MDDHVLPKRFWAKVSINPKGCWEWSGCRINGDGYGQIRMGGGRILAHRLMWEHLHGDIPDGFCVLHRCDNMPCVRPDHLFLGTHDDNMKDKVAKGRQYGGDRHHWRKLSDADMAAIRNLRTKGMRASEIAKYYPVSQSYISAITSDLTQRLGQQSGRAKKLSERAVIEMRRMRRAGFKCRDIAGAFGVSHVQAWMVVTGKSWKHVTREAA